MKYFKRGCLRGFGFAITVSLLLGLAKVHKWWDGKKYFWSSFWYYKSSGHTSKRKRCSSVNYCFGIGHIFRGFGLLFYESRKASYLELKGLSLFSNKPTSCY
jgi:hypothetical protein